MYRVEIKTNSLLKNFYVTRFSLNITHSNFSVFRQIHFVNNLLFNDMLLFLSFITILYIIQFLEFLF